MTKNKLLFSRELVGEKIEDVISDGIESEKLGFDMVWVLDHLVDIKPLLAIFDAWTTLGYLGAKTNSIKLGSGVTDIQRIHPAKTANIIATLDNLTKGRAILGIGAGEIMNTRPFGILWKEKLVRLKRLRETIEVIKLLWSATYDNPVNFHGSFFNLEKAHLSVSPIKAPHPPIYVGSFASKGMLRIAGELADGWYPGTQNTPETFRQKVDIIRESAQKVNRPESSIDIIASIPTFVTIDKDEISKLKVDIKLGLKKKLILGQHLLKVYGIDESDLKTSLPKELDYQFATPGPVYDEKLRKAVENLEIPDDLLENIIAKIIAIGSADECISTIEKFVRAGATHIFFSNFVSSRENYRLISQKVMPGLSGS